MSTETWYEEFGNQTDLEKWIGMREENLKKHGCRIGSLKYLIDEKYHYLFIDSDTCQLCCDNLRIEEGCLICPIYKKIGRD